MLTVALFTSFASAQELPSQTYTLPNGLQVILHEDHSLPQVVVDIWYRVGSKDEIPGRSGFAHLFEHLMFMGTNRLPGSGIDETMEAHGGWNNAFTMEDATNFYDVGPKNLLPTFLWIEADRMEQLGTAMTQAKLDLQRDVVRNERRQSIEDQPYGRVELVYPGAMFPAGHPYAHPVIGSHEDLEAATLKDVQDFFATWYVPNNASLVIAGDFDPATVKPLVEKSFGYLKGHPLPDRAKPAPATGTVTRDNTVQDRVDTPQLDLFWHTPAAYAPGNAECQLVASLLGTGQSSRLYRRLVLSGLAEDVSVSENSLALDSVFEVSVTAMDGVPMDKIEAAVDDEIKKVQTSPASDDEMQRLHNSYEYGFFDGLQSLQNRAVQLNQYAAYTGSPDYLKKDLQRFHDASADGLQKAAQTYLQKNLETRVVVVPAPPGSDVAAPSSATGATATPTTATPGAK